MATFGATLRRGLPRRPGGDPWPPAGETDSALQSAEVVPDGAAAATVDAPVAERSVADAPVAEASASPADEAGRTPREVAQRPDGAGETPASDAAATGAGRALRRGLPRIAGGEPWPPPTAAPAPPAPAAQGAATQGAASQDSPASVEDAERISSEPQMQPQGTQDAAPAAIPTGAVAATDDERPLRRGLPRVVGGEPWPPPGLFTSRAEAVPTSTEATAPAEVAPAEVAPAEVAPAEVAPAEAPAEVAPTEASAPVVPAPAPAPTEDAAAVAVAGPRAPLPFTPTVWAGAAARSRPVPRPEPKRIGPFTRLQWAGAVIVGGGGLLYAAALAVLAVRWLLSTQWGVDFLAAYPGEYHLPEGAPVGFPAWLGWQHFFNVFLMVLIIRSGLQVRTEKRPSAFWSPRSNAKRKISLNLWFHQSLDILWIVNGVIFVALLFVTGQWMRIVPTSWEVFPNALSAALQYVSLDWPTENGWVNYNALQQLAYFTTVFVAAPLAIVTGVRMSGVWPKNAKALNKAYPVEWARAVHFPVMIYFVLFIFVHVVLVFATGALRNLNHMYAAQGSTDPDAYADNWVGFWIFAISMLVIAGAWVAARPLVLAPIARLFGKVSGR